MKTIWKIAKAELNTLFCSPIAWLILIIFAFQAGLTFSDLISDQLRYLALNYRPYNLTSALLLGYSGVYSSMQDNLYLYIPLLTMGLMSKEYSSGSIKLLYSSPITNIQIILGKYISMLVYALILVAGFAARFIINAVQKHNQSDDASSSVSSSSQVDDSSTPDATAAETTEKAAAGDAEIVSITPDETYLAVLEDGTATIKVSLSAHGAANGSSLQWTSSDEKIATVDENGAVKGVAAGTCTISVSAKSDPSVSADVDVAVRHLEEKDGCTYVDGILIVNKTYSLPESYDPAGLTDETQAALDKMIEDAYAAGLNLYDASDYRSYSDQISVYQEYCARDGWEQADTYSARPGHSEHQTGMVIDFNDINSDFDDTAEAQWLEENCANYGFIVRFPEGKEPITGYKYESWHVRYVGVETAKEIMSRGICLEEYLGVDSEYKNSWPEDPCNPESGVSEQ